MKLGRIYDYSDKEEAKKLIGKKVIASDFLSDLLEEKTAYHRLVVILARITDDNKFSFSTENKDKEYVMFQFIREVIEEDEPKLMTNRQLAEWLAKGNGERKLREDEPVSNALIYYEDDENLPVGEDVVIRPWDSDEWVKPTVDIYERDCKGIRRIE